MKITESIEELITDLKDGKIICFKTDTIWGLSVSPYNQSAIESLYKLKKRDLAKPFIFLIKDNENIKKYVCNFNKKKKDIIKNLWPGPVSIVFDFNKKSNLLSFYENKETIALRMPKNDLCQKILKKIDFPLPSTSVNFEKEEPLDSFEEVTRFLQGKNVTVFKSLKENKSLASKIIKFNENDNIYVIRN